MLRYREFAQTYYVKDGQPNKEFTEVGLALRPLREMFGALPARQFGPLKFQAVRQQMIDSGLSRGVINNRSNRIKRFFKWAVSEELIPASIAEGLRTVAGLKRGRTKAKETGPVLPVDDQHVDPVLEQVSSQVAAMIQLQRLTGMRPCEVTLLKGADLNQQNDVWVYMPSDHKNAWRGHDRVIPIGPRAQEVLRPFLKENPDEFLFSPREAEEERNENRKKARVTPMTPSQSLRCRKSEPKRPKRDRYNVDSYRRAIKYGIMKLNRLRAEKGLEPIPNWFPLQLRHSRATELNQQFGIEAAAVSLGHAHADVTKVYAERNLKLAIEVARKTG